MNHKNPNQSCIEQSVPRYDVVDLTSIAATPCATAVFTTRVYRTHFFANGAPGVADAPGPVAMPVTKRSICILALH